MTLPMDLEKPPFYVNADGKALMNGTRVPIDTVLIHFNRGALPEEIVERFPTLELADVYSAIGYYLRRRAVVDAYLSERKRLGDELQALIESGASPDEVVAQARKQHAAV